VSQEKINYSKSGYILILRPDFFSICDGVPTAHALLSLFVHQFEKRQQAWLRTRPGKAGKTAPIKFLLKGYRKCDLVQFLLGIGKDDRVVKAINLLVDKGYISIHKNPERGKGFDNTKHILVHPSVINEALEAAPGTSGFDEFYFYDDELFYLPDPKNTPYVAGKCNDVGGKNPRQNKDIKINKKKNKPDSPPPTKLAKTQCMQTTPSSDVGSILDVIAKKVPVPDWLDRGLFQQWYESILAIRGFLSEQQIILALKSLITQVEVNRWDQATVIEKAIAGAWVKFYPANKWSAPERNETPSSEWLAVHCGDELSGIKEPLSDDSRAYIQEKTSEINNLSRLLDSAKSKPCRIALTKQLNIAQEALRIFEQKPISVHPKKINL
jgi:hypothetical protein